MPYLGAVQLATTTLGSSASSVTFSNIPTKLNGLYLRDLILIVSGTASANTTLRMELNGDTTAGNYPLVYMAGDVSGGAQSSSYSATNFGDFYTTQSMWTIQFQDASATDKHKTYLIRGGRPDNYTRAIAGRWANTNAISSIRMFVGSGTFSIGATLSLYATVRKP